MSASFGRVGHEQFMHHGKQIIPLHPLLDEAAVGAGGHRIGTEHIERFDRWLLCFPCERGAEAVHIDAAGRRMGTFTPFVDRFAVPLQVTAGAVAEAHHQRGRIGR